MYTYTVGSFCNRVPELNDLPARLLRMLIGRSLKLFPTPTTVRVMCLALPLLACHTGWFNSKPSPSWLTVMPLYRDLRNETYAALSISVVNWIVRLRTSAYTMIEKVSCNRESTRTRVQGGQWSGGVAATELMTDPARQSAEFNPS